MSYQTLRVRIYNGAAGVNLQNAIFALAVFAFFCRCAAVSAQEAAEGIVKSESVEKAIEGAPPNEVYSYIRYIPFGSSNNTSGKISIVEAGWEYGYEYKVAGKLPLSFTIGNGYVLMHKDVPLSLPGKLVSFTTDIGTILPVFNVKGLYAGAGISPSFYSDDWSFGPSAFRMPCRGFAAYQPDDKWTFVGGAEVCPRYKDPVWPICGVIYKPVKELEFNLISDSPNIIYRLNDRLALFAEGGFTYEEYTVRRDGAEDITLRYRNLYMGGGTEFKFSKFTRAVLTTGAVLDRELKYKDGGGRVDIAGGFYAGMKMVSEF